MRWRAGSGSSSVSPPQREPAIPVRFRDEDAHAAALRGRQGVLSGPFAPVDRHLAALEGAQSQDMRPLPVHGEGALRDADPGTRLRPRARRDRDARAAALDGVALQLSRLEFDLLAYLMQRPGKVVNRRQLLAEVWPMESRSVETVDVHVTWLRRKLGERAAQPRYLHTVRGVGLMLAAPKDAG